MLLFKEGDNGSFLIRSSSYDADSYVMSVRYALPLCIAFWSLKPAK